MQVVQKCRVGNTIDALRWPERPVILVQKISPPDQTLTMGKEELAPVPVSGTPGVGEAETDSLHRGLNDQIHLTQPPFLPPQEPAVRENAPKRIQQRLQTLTNPLSEIQQRPPLASQER